MRTRTARQATVGWFSFRQSSFYLASRYGGKSVCHPPHPRHLHHQKRSRKRPSSPISPDRPPVAAPRQSLVPEPVNCKSTTTVWSPSNPSKAYHDRFCIFLTPELGNKRRYRGVSTRRLIPELNTPLLCRRLVHLRKIYMVCWTIVESRTICLPEFIAHSTLL